MIRERRLEIITEEIKQKGIVSISELVKKLNASRSTVHRDLCDLQDAKLVGCVRGGATVIKPMILPEPPFLVRKDLFFQEKVRIAKAAFELIKKNDTIILDAGTTVHELAKLLVASSDLYIATNDLNSAMVLSGNNNIDLTVLGGMVRKNHYSIHGYFTEDMISQIHADKLFLGVDAVDFSLGFMNFSMDEVRAKRLMIKAANDVIVLCDHSKFNSIAFVNICQLSEVSMVITGNEISPDIIHELEERGVKLMIV